MFDEFYLHHFEDNVDPYWARTRVLERLNYASHVINTVHLNHNVFSEQSKIGM
jgi:Cu/Ag efflux pump CusA